MSLALLERNVDPVLLLFLLLGKETKAWFPDVGFPPAGLNAGSEVLCCCSWCPLVML